MLFSTPISPISPKYVWEHNNINFPDVYRKLTRKHKSKHEVKEGVENGILCFKEVIPKPHSVSYTFPAL